MRLNIPILLATLASTCAADSMDVGSLCSFGCVRSGRFHTDYGSYEVNAANTCRSTPVPGMVEFCVDWDNKRGHFYFSHQSFKRCMLLVSETVRNGGGFNVCAESRWEERD